jgi:hypothetical protein
LKTGNNETKTSESFPRRVSNAVERFMGYTGNSTYKPRANQALLRINMAENRKLLLVDVSHA